ncbi:MAG TPA: hypothetical protein VMM14_04600 [Acidimicrobiia bacterium]|nr:hypothetical protein [Acidimicrobiia bacterium]
MAIYDGVVSLADDEIPVLVELGQDHVRMSAGGAEIGHWPTAECHIAHIEDGVYTITAEDETLRFVPNQPTLFAAAVNGSPEAPLVTVAPEPEREPGEREPGSPEPDAGVAMGEAPPARPLTMGLFYALCFTTAALAVWALISILF